MKTKRVKKAKLYAQTWKLEETALDIERGEKSRSSGPLEVFHMEYGKYHIMDGHHRAMESEASEFDIMINDQYAYSGALYEMAQNAIRLIDYDWRKTWNA